MSSASPDASFRGFFRALAFEAIPQRPWEGPIPYFTREDLEAVQPLGTEGTTCRLDFASGVRGVFKPRSQQRLVRRSYIPRARPHLREVGAYVVSRLCHLEVVPPTVLARVEVSPDFWPLGSLQAWVDGDMGDLPVEQLAPMAVLDYLIGNTDRHRGNLLIDAQGRPWGIDHAASFPRLKTSAADAWRGRARGSYENRQVERAWEGKGLPAALLDPLRQVDPRALWRALLDLRLETQAADGTMLRLEYLQKHGRIPPFRRSRRARIWPVLGWLAGSRRR